MEGSAALAISTASLNCWTLPAIAIQMEQIKNITPLRSSRGALRSCGTLATSVGEIIRPVIGSWAPAFPRDVAKFPSIARACPFRAWESAKPTAAMGRLGRGAGRTHGNRNFRQFRWICGDAFPVWQSAEFSAKFKILRRKLAKNLDEFHQRPGIQQRQASLTVQKTLPSSPHSRPFTAARYAACTTCSADLGSAVLISACFALASPYPEGPKARWPSSRLPTFLYWRGLAAGQSTARNS